MFSVFISLKANLKFNEEEQGNLDMLHDFCLKEIKPIAAEIDEHERFIPE